VYPSRRQEKSSQLPQRLETLLASEVEGHQILLNLQTFFEFLTMSLMEAMEGNHRLFIMNHAFVMNEEKVVIYYLF
jgi:hypothetical protein